MHDHAEQGERPRPDLSELARELAKPENAALLERLLDGLEEIIADRLGLPMRREPDGPASRSARP